MHVAHFLFVCIVVVASMSAVACSQQYFIGIISDSIAVPGISFDCGCIIGHALGQSGSLGLTTAAVAVFWRAVSADGIKLLAWEFCLLGCLRTGGQARSLHAALHCWMPGN